MKYFLFLVILGSLVACSKPGHSPAKLKVNFGAITNGLGDLIPKILITGQNGTQRFARVFTDGTDTVDIELPNGTWNFLAIAWEANEAGLDGKIRCGGASASLAGGPTAVNVNITNANCFNGSLGNIVSGVPLGGSSAFPPIPISACRDSQGLNNMSGSCSYTPLAQNPTQAIIGSYRVGLRGVTRFATGVTTLATQWLGSNCLPPDNTAQLRLPLLGTQYFVPLTVEAFNTINCTPGRGEMVATIDNSLLRIDASITGYNPVLFADFSDQRVCAARQAASGTMRINDIGIGSDNAPYGLCNLAQLKHWQENFNDHTGINVALLSDLNLLPWIKAGTLGLTPYTTSSCFEDGSTFVPLGHSAATCAPLSSPFTGSLNGLGKKISYFRFSSKEDDVGFVSKIDVEASIANIIFERAELRGEKNVGVAVGRILTSHYGGISNIKANEIDVEASSNAGGLIGLAGATATNLIQLHADGSVESQGSYAGGIIGAGVNASIQYASFTGKVYASDHYAGGIAGLLKIVKQASSSALVQGSNYVGGIAGLANGNSENIRFNGSVIIRGREDIYGGGLIGQLTSGGISRGLMLGSLRSFCETAPCNIGTIAGNGTHTNVYSLQDYSEGSGDAGTSISSSRSSTPALNTNFCSDSNWNCASGGIDTPRFSFEGNHPCGLTANAASVSAQIDAGRGTATNPITICHRDQMLEIDSSPTHRSRVYSLEQNVYAGDTAITAGTAPFLGQFRGNGHAIVGFGGNGVSHLIRQLGTNSNRTPRFEHVKIYGMRLESGGNDVALVATNYGTVSYTRIEGAVLVGKDRVAPFVANNYGIVSKSSVEASILAQRQVGGVVALNLNEGSQRALISEVHAHTHFSPFYDGGHPANTTDFGGIAGLNYGNIQRAMAGGEWRLHNPNFTWSVSNAGGLVGFHQSGSITDSAVSEDFRFIIDQPSTTSVGGLIGEVGGDPGTLARLVSNAFLAYPETATVPTTSARVGYSPFAIPASLVATKGAGRELVIHPLVNFTFSVNTCTSDTLSPAIITGPQDYMVWLEATREYVLGHYSSVDFGFVTEDPDACPAESKLRFHSIESMPNVTSIALMRSSLDFDIVDFEAGTVTEKNRAFQAYLNHLQGLAPPSNTPVWIYEEGRFKPFRVDD